MPKQAVERMRRCRSIDDFILGVGGRVGKPPLTSHIVTFRAKIELALLQCRELVDVW